MCTRFKQNKQVILKKVICTMLGYIKTGIICLFGLYLSLSYIVLPYKMMLTIRMSTGVVKPSHSEKVLIHEQIAKNQIKPCVSN